MAGKITWGNEFILELRRQDLYPVLSEFWASDATGIDTTIWATALAGAGTVTRTITTSSPMRVTLSTIDALAASTARLTSRILFRASPSNYTTSFTPKRFTIQWEARFTTITAFDNTTFFMGLADTTTSTRATNNLIGFGLTTDALRQVTDNAGTESETTPSTVPTLTNWNEYRIEITRLGTTNTIQFFINDIVIATHNTAANIPDINAYLTFFVDNDTTGIAVLDVGAITSRYFDLNLGNFE